MTANQCIRATASALILLSAPLFADDGEQVYNNLCVACHGGSNSERAPGHAAISGMSARSILASMTDGKMRDQAAGLTDAQRKAVAEWWAGAPVQQLEYPKEAWCAHEPKAGPGDQVAWSGWGGDAGATGFRSVEQAGFGSDEVGRLELKWAFGFPGAIQQRSKPAIVGDLLIVGSATGEVYGLDAASGCIHWMYDAGSAVRGAITLGRSPAGKLAAFFADFRTNVHALDVRDGSLIWKAPTAGHHDNSNTGSVAYHEGRLYVPLSSMEVLTARNPDYECCSSSGELVALDADDGEVLWRHRVVESAPRAVGKNAKGADILAPSGAPVWSSPTVDGKRGVVYFGTGESYTHPASDSSDAIVALRLDSGAVAWRFQGTANDSWNLACGFETSENCPDPMGPDVDFGMAPILVSTPAGREVLLVGQKSGVVHALDPDDGGAVLWQTKIGKGSALGGVHWGLASDGKHVWAPNSDSPNGMLGIEPDFPASPGVFALDVESGKIAWRQTPDEGICEGREGCFSANSAAPTAIPGVVFAGGLDGRLKAYSTDDGKVLWDFDTARAFDTVNGVEARGGAIDGPGPVIANGMLYSQSGYGWFGQMPGNVLLAFAPADD